MTRPRRLPAWPGRLLLRVLGNDARGRSMAGDVYQEYASQPAGVRRSARYALACLALAARFGPDRWRKGPGTFRSAGAGLASGLRLDFRQALRSLAHAPGYWLGAVATLALGIGAAATIATIIYGAMLRPVPYPEAQQLVRFGDARVTDASRSLWSMSVADLRDYRRQTQVFSAMAALRWQRRVVSTDALSERLTGAVVTGNFFDVLGLAPRLGRWLTPDDDRPASVPAVVIGERTWQRQFGGRPDAIGRTVLIDFVPYVVVGVAPADLVVPGAPEFWTTFRWDAAAASDRRHRSVEPVGRLRPGATFDQGVDELRRLSAGLAREFPEHQRGMTVTAIPFERWIKGANSGAAASGHALWPLVGAGASLLLLISFINVTSLTLGRAEGRRHDAALRRALGASPGRILRQQVIEATFVGAPAAAVGLLLAAWLVPLVVTRYGRGIPRVTTIAFDSSTVWTAAASALCAVVVLAVSAGHHRSRPIDLRGDRRAGGPGGLRLRRALVTAQVSLVAMLLYGAIVVGGTVWSLSRVNLGVPLEHATTFSLTAPASRYPDPVSLEQFFGTVSERIDALPGVRAVGATSRQPFAGGTNGPVASADDPARAVPVVEWRAVSPGFFEAMGLPIIQGRGFTAAVAARDAGSAVASASLARALFGTERAVGRRIVLEGSSPVEIVGVVADFRDFGPMRAHRPTVYLRHASQPGFAAAASVIFIVRQDPGAPDVAPLIRDRVRGIDPDVPVDRISTLEALAAQSVGVPRRTAAVLLSLFTGVAIALGALGIFGVVAFNVARRTRELGIRLAMGATARGIERRVLAEGARLVGAGMLVGGAGMFWVDGLVSGFATQGARPPVVVVLAGIGLVLAGVALLASYVPARRASRVPLLDALRAD